MGSAGAGFLRAISPAAAVFAAFAASALAAAPPAQVAGSPALEASLDDLEALAETLADEDRRQRLLSQIRALIAAKKKAESEAAPAGFGSGLLAALSAHALETGRQLGEVVDALPAFPDVGRWLLEQATNPHARLFWLALLIKLAAILIVGLAAERLTIRLLRRPRESLEARETESLLVRAPSTLARALLDLVPIAAFAGAAFGTSLLVRPTLRGQFVAIALINAYAAVRGLLAIARMALAPASPSLKVLPIGDAAGAYLYGWTRRFVAVAVSGYFLAHVADLLGLPAGGREGVLRLVGLVLAVLAIVLAMQNRQLVAGWLRGPEAADAGRLGMRQVRRRFADLWHVLAVIYIAGIYGVWALGIRGGFAFIAAATLWSALVLAAARLALAGLDRAKSRAQAGPIGGRSVVKARLQRYAAPAHAILRGAVHALALLGLLQAWGFHAFDLFDAPWGRRAGGALFTIALVVVLAVAVWEAISAAIERYLGRLEESGERTMRSARARTLLPLFRNAVMIVLSVMVTLIVLSELGINIAPLLAGAGVVGLAVGFGAQKLVQDVINGAFILFEDTIAVGDVVDVAGRAGVVEALSIRSIRLRDLSGKVYTIPFSTVDTVINMTKEFSQYVFDIGVSYREDTDRVTEVLREIGAEMQADPEFGPHILEPLEVLGVDRFADSAVVIKARFKTAPLKQWPVGREFNRRMKKRFDSLGIEIPFPQRTVHVMRPEETPSAAAESRAASRSNPDSP